LLLLLSCLLFLRLLHFPYFIFHLGSGPGYRKYKIENDFIEDVKKQYITQYFNHTCKDKT